MSEEKEMKENEGFILAQYTIRSKQQYIFQTNRILEIVGGSKIISDSWDELFNQANKAGLITRRINEGDFCMEIVQKSFDDGSLHMVELFRGGGNDTVLFNSRDSYVKANKAFSYKLMEKYPGIIPMSVCCLYTGDYNKDYRDLMKEAEAEKNRMIPGQGNFTLPFSMMDRTTLQPYSKVITIEGIQSRISDERFSKREVGQQQRNRDQSIRMLDDMVTKKGEESLLAVVHADGNNMGVKISKMLGKNNNYDACVTMMREFTADTANAFVEDGLAAMEDCQKRLREKYKGKNEKAYFFRKVIADGDDMTFICNARFVMEYVRAYLQSVQTYKARHQSEWEYSSCAGICVFHSHYPFARAYALAEQACDSAKKQVHGKMAVEEGWADFHYVHNGIGGDLEQIRASQGTDKCMARPWQLTGTVRPLNEGRQYSKLEELEKVLRECKVSRSDIKTIGSEFESGEVYGQQELIRIYGHHKDLKSKLKEIYGTEEQNMLRNIYDLAEMYDLWYGEER